MKVQRGVEFVLRPRVRVLAQLRKLENVSDVYREINGKRLRCIQIRGGKNASFISGGGVDIGKLPGWPGRFLKIFDALEVLEIRNLATGELIRRNYYCCVNCMTFTLTGSIREGKMRCSSCVYYWDAS